MAAAMRKPENTLADVPKRSAHVRRLPDVKPSRRGRADWLCPSKRGENAQKRWGKRERTQ